MFTKINIKQFHIVAFELHSITVLKTLIKLYVYKLKLGTDKIPKYILNQGEK